MKHEIQPTSMQKQNNLEAVPMNATPGLVHELLPPIRAFTLFPKLPLELRLGIWRFTFPKANVVGIGIAYYGPVRQVGLVVPIALSINGESRTETLKHYFVVVETFPQTALPPKVLCFNPYRDTICLSFDDIFPPWPYGYPHLSLKHHLSKLSQRASETMNKIQELQISLFAESMADPLYSIEELFEFRTNKDGTTEQRGYDSYNAALFHFPGLRTINLEVPEYVSEEEIIRIVITIRAFIEHYKEKLHSGKAPRVVARAIGTYPPRVFIVPDL